MAENFKIIISGAGGFIGSALADYFSKKGWNVTGLVKSTPSKLIPGLKYVPFDLSRELNESIFEGADFFVHCAYVKNNIEENISGTKRLLKASRKYNIKKNIFLTSFSGLPDAVSNYGKQKFEIEKLFTTAKDCIVCPGVVIGHGGLFRQMSEHISKGKWIPLIGGGNQPLQPIWINDLAQIIEKICLDDRSGRFVVADPAAIPYKEFFAAISAKQGIRPKFISVPFFVINALLYVSELFGIKLPVARENMLGLKNMKVRNTVSDLDKLGVSLKSFRESLEFLDSGSEKK